MAIFSSLSQRYDALFSSRHLDIPRGGKGPLVVYYIVDAST